MEIAVLNDRCLEKIGLINGNIEYIELPIATVKAGCGFTGFPSPAMDYEEKNLNIAEYLNIKKNTTWIFRASGESLKELGIIEGDMLVVDTMLIPENNDLCICLVENEYVAKIVKLINGHPYLVSANELYKPVKLDETTILQVFGVITGRIGRFERKNGRKRK